MAAFNAPAASRGMGMASLTLGFLGLAFFWLVPLGIIISLAGLLAGLFAWATAPPAPGRPNLPMAGTALSAIGVLLSLVIAMGMYQTLRLDLF